MLLIRTLLLYTLCWCVLVAACHHSCLMFFRSHYIVKASFCLAGSLPRLQADIFSEFSDIISGQTAVTVDLCGAQLYTSQKYVRNLFVDCVDARCSTILCLQKFSWSETSTFQKLPNVYPQFICAQVKGWENTFIGVHIVGFHCLLKVMYMWSLQAGVGEM